MNSIKCAIFDACFGLDKQKSRGMSSNYLAWELKRNNQKEYSLEDCNVILVSVQYPSDSSRLKTLQTMYRKKIIIAGGAASSSPYLLGLYADIVCVGDGGIFLKTLFSKGLEAVKELPNAWIHKEKRKVMIDQNFPWELPPIQAEDGAYRVWCGRGCKKKCLFCQTGWAYEYKENPNVKHLFKSIADLKKQNKRIAYLSNDLLQHSFYNRLPSVKMGSYSVDYIKKNGLPPAMAIRIGVEGVSERLRKIIKKPILNDDLVKCSSWLNANKKKVKWFMIAGLPYEEKRDWEELKDNIERWKMLTPIGTLHISFTAFVPTPATPLSKFPLNDNYSDYYKDFENWFFHGHGWSNRVKVSKPSKPENRLKSAMACLGLSKEELYKGNIESPNNRINYPFNKQADSFYNDIILKKDYNEN